MNSLILSTFTIPYKSTGRCMASVSGIKCLGFTRFPIILKLLILSTNFLDSRRSQKIGCELAHTTEDMSGCRPWFALSACNGASQNHPSRHQGKQHLVRRQSGTQDCGFRHGYVFPGRIELYPNYTCCRNEVSTRLVSLFYKGRWFVLFGIYVEISWRHQLHALHRQ
jgi:hypothetical protein